METFKIDSLVPEEAPHLCTLMVSNSERFQRFFTKTLAQNLTIKDSKAFILRKQEETKLKTEFTYALREKETATIIGLIFLKKINWNKKQGELAYCIGLEFEGKGWMTKAVKEISKYAFKDLRLSTLQIIAHKSNKGSIRVAEKCGFIWEKTLLKEHTPPNEAPLDMELYILTKK